MFVVQNTFFAGKVYVLIGGIMMDVEDDVRWECQPYNVHARASVFSLHVFA